ncbi:G-type lectin S-receptor-like serine/threonine-protein kinase At4g27290 isoform X1 [Ziziphus jujuba]|uniref:Receptor-like serine/threonine-protein kinase n=2 Tax=Ziziphus jujuba TaxID=326968 RepID=A0A6P4AP90_ZIZJJ|nr:G-type lectin S-receptor-like serine/threonine-protein kinase At4g27290 isoform X1 [Ziziphus jujuba]
MEVPSFMFFTVNLLICFTFSLAADSIRPLQSISDGKTLVSKEGNFEVGFFSPGSSKNRYLGIWYKKLMPVRTVVWVANRCNPIEDSSGLLTINSTGNLVLLGQNRSVVWWTSSPKQAQNPLVQILDSGNLVLRDEKNADAGSYFWQSFDYPSDTLLPEMKLGWDLRTGLKRGLSAWRNPEDPCPGNFTYGLELGPRRYPEEYIWNGTTKYYRTGPWNGLRFSGLPELKANDVYGFKFVYSDDEVYYTYTLKVTKVISRVVLNQTTGKRERSTWIMPNDPWTVRSSLPKDKCDDYGLCGANAKCSIIGQNPICECLKGFKPKSQENWNKKDWSQGCERNLPLSCQEKHRDGFVKFVGLKLPDTTHTWMNNSMNLEECRTKCLNNCSCMAYVNSDIRGNGSGCVLWFGDLVDMKWLADGGQDLHVRMPAAELDKMKKPRGNGKMKTTVIAVAVIGVVSGMLFLGVCIHRRRKASLKEKTKRNEMVSVYNGDQNEDLELPFFDLSTVAAATENFSLENKIGEGGFGPVYRGMLDNGKEIAVKRLSLSSGQGVNEFKNEVILIAKLQHRNLVRLLGCCIEGEEKMLVYEYMPNKSLHSFIFDEKQGKLLGWSQRFQIICGIARGLLYLHQDSRLRIIHRDLKASNVLLDKEMNPKISDFGMAKTFGGDQTEGNTNRVVGTYGYMAPEYAFDGQFSTKSDVFSFGILMLEIISGKKSRSFHHQNHGGSLIGHAWTLMQEGKPSELIDACMDNYKERESEVLRCIHISLLCVQHHAVDRPSMSSVVMMLGGEGALVQPKPPGYFMERDFHLAEAEYSSSTNKHVFFPSINEMTISLMEAR